MRLFPLHLSRSAFRAGIHCGLLLLAGALTISSASAQTLIATAATRQEPVPSSLRNSPIATVRTPLEVISGTARLVGRLTPESKIRLTLGLNPPHMAEEEKFLAELQDRNSPNFHKYLTAAQWNARFAPSAADEQAVIDWLTANGMTVTQRYANRLVVDAEASSQVVEKAFAVQVNNYTLNEQAEFSNDRDPVIPAHLTGILRSVGGLNSIQRAHAPHEGNIQQVAPRYSAGAVSTLAESNHANGDKAKYAEAVKAAQEAAGSSSTLKGLTLNSMNEGASPQPGITNGFIDPTDIYSSQGYDFNALQAQGHCCNPTHNAAGATPTTSIAIATAGDFASADITGFQAQYTYLAYYYNRVYVDGTPSCCNDETTLDTEWAIATSNSFGSYLDTARVWVYEGANNYLSTFTDVYNKMLSDGNARIFSTSWGCAELTCSDSGTMDTDHAIFNSMLGQGWTILALSHDYGATGGCDAALRVTYPGSDPDAVSVGGTSLAMYSDGTFYSETAWEGGTSAGSCSHNNGGSGGGCSRYYAAPGYQSSPYCGASSRSVPDIALNAGYGQNYYFGGALHGVGGTSISTPQVAGFMAQENAYLMAIGVGCGTGFTSVCAPMGQADNAIYREGYAEAGGGSYAPHNPFYDTNVGCNNNDITATYGLGYYCAGTGYDAITGWGSFNALQLSWAINTYYTGDFVGPKVTFSGPAVSTLANTWFNTEQTVSWTVADQNNGTYPSVGVAGFSQAWDSAFSDPSTEPHGGSGNSFYSGPQFPNATSGYLHLSDAGQGCHYATVDAWDNTGFSSGNKYYYWLCYDTIAPVVTPATTPAANTYGWSNKTEVTTLSSTDPGTGASGVTNTYYSIDTTACSSTTLGSCVAYGGPISIATEGYHYIAFFAKDLAGNFSTRNYDYVYIDKSAPVTTAALSGTLSGAVYASAVQVTLAATDNLSGVFSTSYQVDGGPVTAYSGPIAVATLGAHTVKFFSADYASNTETAKSVTFSISAATANVLAATPNPGLNGQAVTLTATLTAGLGANPTGTVTFKNGGTTLGSAAVAAGVAHLTVASLPFGNNNLTAIYGGAANILPSTSAVLVEAYHQKTTTLLTSSANPSLANQPVTFTATITPAVSGTPGGTVQFFNGATLLGTAGVVSGVANFTTNTLAVGTAPMKAIYSGGLIYQTSTSNSLSQVVKKNAAAVAVTSSINPSSFNQSVTFTAAVTSAFGIPSGTVTFYKNGTSFATATLNGAGKATAAISNLIPGPHAITASYLGNTSYLGATSAALDQEVVATATQTRVTSSLNPSKNGQLVTYSATVTTTGLGTPAGSVTFMDGTTVLGTGTLAGGVATLSKSLTAGVHPLTAIYAGNADYLTSTSPVYNQTVNRQTTTTALVSSLNPSTHGTAVTFTATVTAAGGPTPTGTVTFSDGPNVVATGTLNGAGVANFTSSTLTVGTHHISALYNQTTNNWTSTSPTVLQVVN